MILVDTNVFIEVLQGTALGQKVVETLEGAEPDEKFAYSVLTWFELCARPRQTEAARRMLEGFEAVPLTSSMAENAADLFSRHMSANRRRVPDALIAATALALGARLWTFNKADFKRIPRLNFFE